jgi:hypothetical protein
MGRKWGGWCGLRGRIWRRRWQGNEVERLKPMSHCICPQFCFRQNCMQFIVSGCLWSGRLHLTGPFFRIDSQSFVTLLQPIFRPGH